MTTIFNLVADRCANEIDSLQKKSIRRASKHVHSRRCRSTAAAQT